MGLLLDMIISQMRWCNRTVSALDTADRVRCSHRPGNASLDAVQLSISCLLSKRILLQLMSLSPEEHVDDSDCACDIPLQSIPSIASQSFAQLRLQERLRKLEDRKLPPPPPPPPQLEASEQLFPIEPQQQQLDAAPAAADPLASALSQGDKSITAEELAAAVGSQELPEDPAAAMEVRSLHQYLDLPLHNDILLACVPKTMAGIQHHSRIGRCSYCFLLGCIVMLATDWRQLNG